MEAPKEKKKAVPIKSPAKAAKIVAKPIPKPHVLMPQSWMVDAFGDIVKESEPKRHLFKLLEFNKIEVLRSQRLQMPTSDIEAKLSTFLKDPGLEYYNEVNDALIATFKEDKYVQSPQFEKY
jgi:hypothetical protein